MMVSKKDRHKPKKESPHPDIHSGVILDIAEPSVGGYVKSPEIPAEPENKDLLKAEALLNMMEDLEKERKKAIDSSRWFQMLFNSASDSIFISSIDDKGKLGRFMEVNKAAVDVLGFSKDELLRLTPRDLENPLLRPKDYAGRTKQFMREKAMVFVQELLRKDRTRVPMEISSHIFSLEGRNIMISLGRDITERKKSEGMLLESEEKFREIFDRSADGIAIADQKTRKFSDVNSAFLAYTGYSKKELVGMDISGIHPKKDFPYVLNEFTLQSQGKKTLAENIPVLRKDKKVLYADVKSYPITLQGKRFTIGMFRDITEKMDAKKKLFDSEKKYHFLAENTVDIIYSYDSHGKITYISPNVKIFGYRPEECIGKSLLDFVHPKDRLHVKKEFLRTMRTKESFPTSLRLLKKDKSFIYAEELSKPIIENSKVVGFIGTIRDVTERLESQKKIEESERRFRVLFEYAPDAIYLNDLKGDFIDVNIAAERLTGFKKKELVGKNFLSLGILPKEEILRAAKLFAKNPFGRSTGPDEFTFIRKDKVRLSLEISTYPVEIEGHKVVMGIARDISQRKKAEEENRLHVLQMELIGKIILEGSSAKDSDVFLDRLLGITVDAFNFTGGAVYMVEGSGRYASIRSKKNLSPDFLRLVRRVPTASRPHSIIFREGKPIITEDYTKIEPRLAKYHIRGLASVPIVSDKGVIGAFNIFKDRPYSFSPGEKGLMVDIGRVIGATIAKIESENELIENEEKYRNVVERANDCILIIQDEVFVYTNPAFSNLLGYTSKELAGRSVVDFLAKEEAEKVLRIYKRRMKGEKVPPGYSTIFVSRKGERIDVDVNAGLTSLNGRTADLVFLRDVTAQKRVEQKLVESEEKNKAVVENSFDGIVVAQEGFLKFVNPAAMRIAGYNKKEMLSKPFLLFIHPDDRKMVADFYRRRMKGEKVPNTYDFRILCKGGSVKWVTNSVSPFRWDGKPATLNFLRDITEKKQVEEKLKDSYEEIMKSHDILNNLITHAGIPVISYDMKGKILVSNREFEETTGYKRDELAAEGNMIDLLFPAVLVSGKVKAALSAVKKGHMVRDLVIPIRSKSGMTSIMITNITPIKNDDGDIIGKSFFMRDISEIFKLEKEIRYWASNGYFASEEEHQRLLDNIEISGKKTPKKKVKLR